MGSVPNSSFLGLTSLGRLAPQNEPKSAGDAEQQLPRPHKTGWAGRTLVVIPGAAPPRPRIRGQHIFWLFNGCIIMG